MRGLVFCECGSGLTTWYTQDKTGRYDYYTCLQRRKYGKAAYSASCWRAAEDLEGTIAGYVSDLLSDPRKIKAQLDAAIAEETGMLLNPDVTARYWADKISECARKREAYQDQQAVGYVTLDELGRKLAELDEVKATTQRELHRLQDAQKRVKEPKDAKRALLEAYGKGLLARTE